MFAAATRVLFILVLIWAWAQLWPKAKARLVTSIEDALRPPGWFLVTLDILVFVVLVLITMANLQIVADNVFWMLSDFFNPEFYALHQLPGWPR